MLIDNEYRYQPLSDTCIFQIVVFVYSFYKGYKAVRLVEKAD